MDQWEDLDLLEPSHITFLGKDSGELVFAAVEADLDGMGPSTPRVSTAGARSWSREAASAEVEVPSQINVVC
jgi:hypothetical protein